MKTSVLIFSMSVLISACSSPIQVDSPTPSLQEDSSTTANIILRPDKRASYLDSSVRNYSIDDYLKIDTFSKANKERKFDTKKPFVRMTFSFNDDKVWYNTGVKSEKFTASIIGFNTGRYQLENSPMDGLVVRAIDTAGYWFIQANVANGTIHERMTIDVLFIRNDQVEQIPN